MSVFGEYVHLYWEHYKESGTNRDTYKKSNFSSTIFKGHLSALRIQAKSTSTSRIKQLENEYNDIIRSTYYKLKNEAKYNPTFLQDFLILLNKSWSSNITGMSSRIQWKDSENKLVIDRKGGVGLYSGNVVPKGYGTAFSKMSTSNLTSITVALNKVKKVEDAFQKMNFSDSNKTNILNTLKGALLNYQKTLGSQYPSSVAKTHLDPKDPSDIIIIQQFNQLVDGYQSFTQIQNFLDWKIPEIFGDVGTKGVLEVRNTSLNSFFQNFISTGQKTTTPLKQQKMYMKLNQFWLKEEYKNNKSGLSSQIQERKIGKKNKIKYTIKPVGQGRAYKSDVEWIIDEETLGISLKTTSLSNPSSKYPNISLQSSSLMLYLLGMHNMNSDLGNHYLNVLAEHEDEDSVYANLRKDANKALKLAIGYSALSGANQTRSGGQAQIFAVWDKQQKNAGYNRVRFYSIETIIQQLGINPDILTFSPSIDDLKLKNTGVNLYDDEEISRHYKRKFANMRITQLLADARSKVIKVSISKTWLNDVNSGKRI